MYPLQNGEWIASVGRHWSIDRPDRGPRRGSGGTGIAAVAQRVHQ